MAKCSTCSHSFEVPARLRGRVVPCPACGAQVTPDEDAPPPPPPPAPAKAAEPDEEELALQRAMSGSLMDYAMADEPQPRSKPTQDPEDADPVASWNPDKKKGRLELDPVAKQKAPRPVAEPADDVDAELDEIEAQRALQEKKTKQRMLLGAAGIFAVIALGYAAYAVSSATKPVVQTQPIDQQPTEPTEKPKRPQRPIRRTASGPNLPPAVDLKKIISEIDTDVADWDAVEAPAGEAQLKSLSGTPSKQLDVDTAWQVVPNRPPTLAFQSVIDLSNGRILDIQYASSKALIAIHRAPPQKALGPRVEVYDIAKGELISTLALEPGDRLLDLSPHGTIVATTADGGQAIALWSVASGNVVKQFTPHATENGAADSALLDVNWAGFHDESHLLTLGGNRRRLTLWKLPQMTAVYTLPSTYPMTTFLSPQRKYLVVSDGRSGFCVEPVSGKTIGQLQWPVGLKAEPMAKACFAFDATGGKLAMGLKDANLVVATWDMHSGGMTAEIVVPAQFSELQWMDDQTVLVAEKEKAFLVDLNLESVVWRYELIAGRLAGTGFGGPWIVGGVNRQHLIRYVIHDKRNTDSATTGLPRSLSLLGPGESITLDTKSISDIDENHLRQSLRFAIERAGMKVAPGQRVQLVASTLRGQVESQEIPSEYFDYPNATDVTVRYRTSRVRLELVDRETSTKIWEAEREARPTFTDDLVLPKTATPSTYIAPLANELKRVAILALLRSARLPRRVQKHPTDVIGRLGLGQTEVDCRRVKDMVSDRANAQVARAGDENPAQAQPAQNRSPKEIDTDKDFVNLLVMSGAGLKNRMRWLSASPRPTIGIRWGLATLINTGEELTNEQQIESLAEFQQIFGRVGVGLGEELGTRIVGGKFGSWTQIRETNVQPYRFLGSAPTKAEIKRRALAARIDCVVILEFTAKAKASFGTIRLRVIDLHNAEKDTISPALTKVVVPVTRTNLSDNVFVSRFMQRVETTFAMRGMPTISTSVAAKRAEHLASSKTAYPLCVLAEIRYYEVMGVLRSSKAAECYARVLDDSAASILSTGTAAERRTYLETWLAEQAAE